MAKSTFKNLGRRGTALFLALVMMVSLLHISAFAAYSDQVMDGYFAVDSDGVATPSESTDGIVTEDGYTLSKTIRQTGENTFDVTLQVQTSQTIVTSHPASATVLVIDLSNSMVENRLGDYGTRMDAAKQVAKQFLQSYAGNDENAEQWLSVVWFGTNSGVDQEWVNVAGGPGKNSYDTVYNYLENLWAPHSHDTGGTNLDAGLEAAAKQLNARQNENEQKNVVLLTDGVPTFRNETKTGYDWWNDEEYTYTEVVGSGSSGSKENNDAAKAEADAIKASGADLYTVCLAAENNVCYKDNDKCKNCGKTKDQHNTVVRCRNCGKAESEHTGRWKNCPTGRGYYNGESVSFCDTSNTKQFQKGYEVTVGNFLRDEIASTSDKAFNANSVSELGEALKAIAAEIEKNGNTGAGTTVTDPMGAYIVLGDVSGLTGVRANDGTLTWTLDPENAEKKVSGNTTTYTYTITYPIVLDTTANGFREKNEDGSTKYYPANGYTSLNIPQENGKSKQIAFLVPGVCGTVPQTAWRVEYYLQDASSINAAQPTYTLDDSKTMDAVKYWTTVSAPAGYETKYNGKHYHFASGYTEMEITPTGENVMRLYYELDTELVTVNHYYKTDIIRPDGSTENGTYPEKPDKTSTEYCVVGSSFTAQQETTFGGASYELEKADPNETITVTEKGDNQVDLYYTRVMDQRVVTSAEVKHVYTTYGYELQNGKYVLTETGSFTETAEMAGEVRATTVFNVSTSPLHEGYTLNTEKGDYQALLQSNGTLSFVVKEKAEDNIRTLYFDKIVDNRQQVSVTVNHYYTKTTTSIEDGKLVTTISPDNVKGNTTTETAYVGESFQATEINRYKDDTYVSDGGNAAKLHIDALTGDVTIDLYYTLQVQPEKTTLIVNHIWRTYTEVTVEETETVTDPETGEETTVVTGTKTERRETVDHQIDGSKNPVELYVGQSYTAPQESWGTGYVFNAQDSKDTGIGGTDTELNLYYDRDQTADERAEASITVQHVYKTKLTTIVGGQVKTIEQDDGTDTKQFPAEGETLRAGDSFTPVEQCTYGEYTYQRTSSDEVLNPVILQPGANATIVIYYERNDSDLQNTTYQVDHEYRTYTMKIDANGAATYGDPVVETETGSTIDAYVNQTVMLDAGNRDGFTPLASNPSTTQTLAEDGNHWTFVHEKYIPLEQGSVKVNHHYTTKTIALDGTETSKTDDAWGTPVSKYLGERYAVAAVRNGFTLDRATVNGTAATVDADVVVTTVGTSTVVDFYYSKTEDHSVKAFYSIAHEYYTYDWNGKLISTSKPEPTTGTGFVSTSITGSPEPNDYTLTGVTYNGAPLAAPYTIQLAEGQNNLVFTYEKHLQRSQVDVKVIHNYYQDEAAIAAGADPLSVYQETISSVEEESSYTAAERTEKGYVFHSATPENKTITVKANGENVIILNYIRATASYEIVHVYRTNNSEDGRTTQQGSGLVGDVVKGDSIERIPTYSGNGLTYRFTSITADITLNADTVERITLIYDRSTGSSSDDDDDGPINPPKPGPGPTEEIPDDDVPTTDLPDEDVPMTDLPDEKVPTAEIPDEAIPLADVPKTGDSLALYYALCCLSGAGLIVLALTGKKRKEEA